jgi:hypothetical protein
MATGGETVGKRNQKVRLTVGAHQCSALGKNSRKFMKDLYYWFKTVDQLAISISIGAELLFFVLKEV